VRGGGADRDGVVPAGGGGCNIRSPCCNRPLLSVLRCSTAVHDVQHATVLRTQLELPVQLATSAAGPAGDGAVVVGGGVGCSGCNIRSPCCNCPLPSILRCSIYNAADAAIASCIAASTTSAVSGDGVFAACGWRR